MFEKEILSRIEKLISKGKDVLASDHDTGVIAGPTLDIVLFSEWQVQVSSLLSSLFPDNESPYLTQFTEQVKRPFIGSTECGIGILNALHEDISSGYLFSYELSYKAEIFSDFLEMAEYLLQKKYKDPAAYLTGAVLENSLKKICERHNITLRSKEDINSLNTKLADKNVYSRFIQKKINIWNDIRNSAVHGLFENYSINDVDEMIKGVNDFLENYLKE